MIRLNCAKDLKDALDKFTYNSRAVLDRLLPNNLQTLTYQIFWGKDVVSIAR